MLRDEKEKQGWTVKLILLSIYSICQYQWIGLNFHVGSSHVITESSELLNALGEISWLLKLVCVLTLIYWSHHFQLTHLTTVNLQRIKSDIPTLSDCYFDSERRRTIKREGAEWICASRRPVVDRLISVSHSFSFFLVLSSQTTHLGKKIEIDVSCAGCRFAWTPDGDVIWTIHLHQCIYIVCWVLGSSVCCVVFFGEERL